MSAKWVGLDPALSAFGHALFSQESLGAAVRVGEVGVWRTAQDKGLKKMEDSARRIDLLAAELCDFLDRHRPDLVFTEGLVFVPAAGFITGAILGRVRGMVDGVCKAKALPLFEFNTQKVKSFLTGERGAEKSEVARALVKLYPTLGYLRPESDENATDAAAVAHLGASSEQVAWHLARVAS